MSRSVSTKVLSVESAAAHLRSGGLLIYPTETSYALGCDATNLAAVRAIFRLKGRERGKPLPLIVASRSMAERYAQFTPLARRLAKRYWPGPLTMVLSSRRGGFYTLPQQADVKSAPTLANGVIASDGTLALRVSSHPIARALSRRLGHPIVSTSANRSGAPSCISVSSAFRSLGHAKNVRSPKTGKGLRGVLAVDVGALPRRRPSTIIDARGERPMVLRRGAIRL